MSQKFPDIIFLHPFHDGVAVALKIEDRAKIEEAIPLVAEQISANMRMSPSIQMEAKYFKEPS